ncbi:hypothetical protein CPB85DRAFT_790817 [Mucidula mucida]|nr:hypothetical protein CPB85DRAFT_790817 [Mucidula mucida]
MDQLLDSVADMIEAVVHDKLKDSDIQFPSLNHLLSSNECPSERETLDVTVLNRQLDLRIAKQIETIDLLREGIRDVVHLFHGAIAKLDADQKRAIDDKKAYTCVLAPARRLPTEILQVIFRFAVGKSFDALSVVRGPWALGKVCRRWRRIALSTPELWSSFRLDSSGPRRLTTRSDTASGILECMLALSQRLPLRVFADTNTTSLITPEFVIVNVLWCVLSAPRHLQRLQEFNLPVDYAHHSPIYYADPGNLRNLETLRLIMSREEYGEWPAFRDLPKLKTLVLRGPGSGALLSNLPYNQLSELSLMGWGSFDEIIDLLQSCPNLQVLEVLDTQGNPPISQYLTFPCLYRLVSDVALIQYLTLPAIRELELVGVYYQSGYDDVLRDLFDRSGTCAKLVKFRITSDATIMGLNNVLRTMPSLVELIAEAVSFQSIFIDTFLGLLSISSFLPLVEKISLAIHEFRKGSLRSFQLKVGTTDVDIDPQDIVRVQTLRAQGLDMGIFYGNRQLLAP